MKNTPHLLLVYALALTGASALIVPAMSKAPKLVEVTEGTHIATWGALKSAVKSASSGAAFILDDGVLMAPFFLAR